MHNNDFEKENSFAYKLGQIVGTIFCVCVTSAIVSLFCALIVKCILWILSL